MRNFIGIFFFIISGFFIYMLHVMSFMDFQVGIDKKLQILGAICIPIVIFHTIALVFYRGVNWLTSTGITFMSVSTFNVFSIITFISIKYSPELFVGNELETLDKIHNDYSNGLSVTVVFILIGATCYFMGKKRTV